MIFDPLYLILMIPGLIVAMWAQGMVKSAYAKAGKITPRSGMTGAQAAARILSGQGLDHVGIELTRGFLGDHYDPRHKVLRLSPDVYNGRSLAAVGIAAHEAGHAIQDKRNYAPLAVRNAIVPMASFGSTAALLILLAGIFMGLKVLAFAGVVLFGVVVLFQLVNLPVEFNASRRAREILVEYGIVTPQEDGTVAKVLNAAAMTYVAATISAILMFLYALLRSGLLGGRR